jgi:hypothetical protein
MMDGWLKPNSPVVSFYTLIPNGRAPERADRSAGGILPTRAFRYCEPVTTASAFGWHIFPPIGLSLVWDGSEVAWTYEGAGAWYTLKSAQFPGFADRFDRIVPDDLKGFSPPFLSALPEPGLVQIWSGFVVRTAPGWSLLIRPSANVPRSQSYEMYEGIIETDEWFGPLFINLRLTRTHVPIEIDPEFPLFQVQPIHRSAYASELLDSFRVVPEGSWTSEDWDNYRKTVKEPNIIAHRQPGLHAVKVRKRRKQAEQENAL